GNGGGGDAALEAWLAAGPPASAVSGATRDGREAASTLRPPLGLPELDVRLASLLNEALERSQPPGPPGSRLPELARALEDVRRARDAASSDAARFLDAL